MAALNQTGAKPASIRLVDNVQFRLGQALKPAPTDRRKVLTSRMEKLVVTRVKGFDPHQMVAATIGVRGQQGRGRTTRTRSSADTAKKFGGISGGAGNGERGYMLTYAIAYIRDFLADYYIVGETYETTVPWSRIHDVCAAVKRVAKSEHQRARLPGQVRSPRRGSRRCTTPASASTSPMALDHRGIEDGDEKFAEMENNMRAAIMDAGGSISHHHGIGKLRNCFVDRVASPETPGRRSRPEAGRRPSERFRGRNNIFADSSWGPPRTAVTAGRPGLLSWCPLRTSAVCRLAVAELRPDGSPQEDPDVGARLAALVRRQTRAVPARVAGWELGIYERRTKSR